MNKTAKIIIGIVAVVAIVAIIVLVAMMNQKPKTNLEPIKTSEDLSKLIDKVYEGQENLLGSLTTTTIDVTDADLVKSFTGLENGNDLEFLAVSEPMISSQAYSFVLAKVKSGVDANQIAQKMSKQVNPSKWICVTADKIYSTNSADVVCLVMSSEERAKPVYNKFKELAGTVGQEYEETYEETFPEEFDMVQ